jgi:hypothetical protein
VGSILEYLEYLLRQQSEANGKGLSETLRSDVVISLEMNRSLGSIVEFEHKQRPLSVFRNRPLIECDRDHVIDFDNMNFEI